MPNLVTRYISSTELRATLDPGTQVAGDTAIDVVSVRGTSDEVPFTVTSVTIRSASDPNSGG